MDEILKIAKELFYERGSLPLLMEIKDKSSTLEVAENFQKIYQILNEKFLDRYMFFMVIPQKDITIKIDYKEGEMQKLANLGGRELYFLERGKNLRITTYNTKVLKFDEGKEKNKAKSPSNYNILKADMNCQIYELDTKHFHEPNDKNCYVSFVDETTADNKIFLIKEAEIKEGFVC